MRRPFWIALLDASVFIVLAALGATAQSWLKWKGFLATSLFLIPAIAYMAYRLPDPRTGAPMLFSDILILVCAIVIGGVIARDVFQLTDLHCGLVTGLFFYIGEVIVDRLQKWRSSRASNSAVSGSID